MRLDRVYINGFKNLKNIEVDFDESCLTTVIIGQNGAGKSNFIEAIVDVFRFVDLNRGAPRYIYEIDYRIGNHKVRLANRRGKPTIAVDGKDTALDLRAQKGRYISRPRIWLLLRWQSTLGDAFRQSPTPLLRCDQD